MHGMTIALGASGLAISLGVHECGHLLAGLLMRFQFHLFALGPLLVERGEVGGIRVTWNREPAFWGGVFVVGVPVAFGLWCATVALYLPGAVFLRTMSFAFFARLEPGFEMFHVPLPQKEKTA